MYITVLAENDEISVTVPESSWILLINAIPILELRFVVLFPFISNIK